MCECVADCPFWGRDRAVAPWAASVSPGAAHSASGGQIRSLAPPEFLMPSQVGIGEPRLCRGPSEQVGGNKNRGRLAPYPCSHKPCECRGKSPGFLIGPATDSFWDLHESHSYSGHSFLICLVTEGSLVPSTSLGTQ